MVLYFKFWITPESAYKSRSQESENMKIVLWNCNNGLGRAEKIDYLMSFKPDLAIIPEIKEHNIEKLNPSKYIWITNNPKKNKPKGLGVLAFNGINITSLPRDSDMEIFIPVRVESNTLSFNLLAVWNFYDRCKQGRFKDVTDENRVEYSALKHYKNLFEDHCLIVGDWNIGPTLKSTKGYQRLNEILGQSNILSLYHLHKGIDLMNTDYATHVHARGKSHIIDHIFGSPHFQTSIESFEIPKMSEVVLSDHAPLVLKVS
jgi:exonuclease III